MIPHFTVVHAGDPRYRGGTASALRTEIAAAHRHGVSAALLPYLGPRSRVVQGFDPRIRAVLEATGTPILPWDQPATTDLLLAHHPAVFAAMPDRPVALQPRRVVCVLHHPPFDGARVPQYDLHRVLTSLALTFAAPVGVAAVGPLVRTQLEGLTLPDGVTLEDDLPNLIDLDDWPERDRPPPRERAVIGRHSRSDPLKWPDTEAEIRAAWPTDDTLSCRVLGPPRLPGGLETPPDWTVLPFRETGVSDFLRSLDFYVYFHSRDWVEAFGIAIAEALATGLVTFLPRELEPTFGDAALYVRPDEVRSAIRYHMSRPDAYARQARAARSAVDRRFGFATYPERLEKLLGSPPQKTRASLKTPELRLGRERPQRVLMVCGNGIGLGHVTRLAAVARRLPDGIEPVFLTLSLGTGLLRDMGFSADYVPTHGRAGVTGASWNDAFALELLALIDATGARMVVFDGNDAFPSIRRVAARRRDVSWVWIRRGLFRPGQPVNAETERLFDMIVEPEDLAGTEDGGATAGRSGVERVGPILLHAPGDRLDRPAAARALELDPGRKTVALQLGSQRNVDLAEIRDAVAEAAAAQGAQVIEIANPLADPPAAPTLPRRAVYPLYPVSAAIDLLVTTAGYNAVHECLLGDIDAVFVPNEAPEMDDQALRARVAEAAGLAQCLRRRDLARAAAAVRDGLDTEARARRAERRKRLVRADGAAETALLIAEVLGSVRTDLPLVQTMGRTETP